MSPQANSTKAPRLKVVGVRHGRCPYLAIGCLLLITGFPLGSRHLDAYASEPKRGSAAIDPDCAKWLSVISPNQAPTVSLGRAAATKRQDQAKISRLSVAETLAGYSLGGIGSQRPSHVEDVAAILAIASATTYGGSPVVLELVDFSPDRAKAFCATVAVQLEANLSSRTIAIAHGKERSNVLSAIELKPKQIGKVTNDPISEVAEGERRGWFSGILRFFVGNSEFIIEVVAQKYDAVSAFISELKAWMTHPKRLRHAGWSQLPLGVLIAELKRDLVVEHGLKRSELDATIRQQLSAVQFGLRDDQEARECSLS